jgi:succinate dehydrogenase/fumarate reductase flavoprotein subunit
MNELNSKMSRRRLLGATAGAAAAAAPFMAAAQATPEASPLAEDALLSSTLPDTWDQETDVIVVGTGAAGFAAAVTAAQAGAEVIILERAGNAGGTTLISGGEFWIPNNSKMVAAGKTDPKPDALKYMARLSYANLYDADSPTLGLPQQQYDMLDVYYDTGSVAVDKLEEWGALYNRIQPSMGYSEFPDFADPDYHADLPEDKAPYGRGLNPDPDKGGSGAIPVQMQKWTDDKGIPLLLNHRVIGLYQNSNGEVVGVRIDNEGTELNFRAKKGVFFGTGGFTQSLEKNLAYLRGPVFASCSVGTCTGDFVDIGIAAGAELGNMQNAWWLQCPLELALAAPSLPGADTWIPYGDSMIIVNKYGERITTEKMVYNERGQTHHWWNPAKREFSNLVQFMIYDDAVAQDPTEFGFRFPVPAAGKDADYVIKGETWEELIQNISDRLDSIRGKGQLTARVGADVVLADDFLDKFSQTLERFNGFAESGVDEDFGRGSTPIQIAWGGGTTRFKTNANPTMAPFATKGPYYCILLGSMTLDTKGGPVTDTSARVLHINGSVIPGLYGAGNCVASPAGQAYWSGGGTIGPALTFGYIAGNNLAAEPEKALV